MPDRIFSENGSLMSAITLEAFDLGYFRVRGYFG